MQSHTENKVYAGFFVRLVAFAIDSLIATLIVAMVKSPFSIAASSGADFLKANFIFHYSFLDVLSYVGVAAYFVLLTYFTHTTAGKKMLRLEVVTETGDWTLLNVIYRETIGRFFSSLLCVGYLAVLVQDKKQGFHDMLCNTYVVYKDVMPKVSSAPVGVGVGVVEPNVSIVEPDAVANENMENVAVDLINETPMENVSTENVNMVQPPVYHVRPESQENQ